MKNEKSLWQKALPPITPEGHKYHRGHALVTASPFEGSGATKLAAEAALRAGAGLVTVACDKQTLPMYAAHFRSVMVRTLSRVPQMLDYVHERKVGAAIIGCGNGVTEATRKRVLAFLKEEGVSLVLDADAT
jgi:NAD(P)H-hydrate repair Nnr-like enzyme with NAD(P)H-hydrate dehydratase domain